MLPDRVSNPGPLTYESGALPIALRGPGKTRFKLNKPVYVGMCVLDLSKHLMYDWYFNTLKRKYGSDCTLLYTDTNSLMVDLKTPDVYTDMESMKTHYDFSDYPKDHPLFSEQNKKVIGKFKDECSGTPIAEYVGLRSKMYSILRADEQLIKKAKVSRNMLSPNKSTLQTTKMHYSTRKHTATK